MPTLETLVSQAKRLNLVEGQDFNVVTYTHPLPLGSNFEIDQITDKKGFID